jgi:hypothetical protein
LSSLVYSPFVLSAVIKQKLIILKILATDKLPSQFFTINTGQDTILITSKGAVIRIPKGAISGDENTVQLEIKEAYSIEDIFRAGLTTQSNGQPLSSGGMIYIML